MPFFPWASLSPPHAPFPFRCDSERNLSQAKVAGKVLCFADVQENIKSTGFVLEIVNKTQQIWDTFQSQFMFSYGRPLERNNINDIPPWRKMLSFNPLK